MCVEEEVRLTAFDVMSRSVVATLDMSPEIGLLPIQAASMNGDGLLHVKRGSKGITRATYANVDPAVAWKIPRALRAASVVEGNFALSGSNADKLSTAKRSRMSLSRMTFSRSSTLVVDYDKIFGASIDVDQAASHLERQQAELFGNAQRGQRGQGGPDVTGAQSAINEAYQVTLPRVLAANVCRVAHPSIFVFAKHTEPQGSRRAARADRQQDGELAGGREDLPRKDEGAASPARTEEPSSVLKAHCYIHLVFIVRVLRSSSVACDTFVHRRVILAGAVARAVVRACALLRGNSPVTATRSHARNTHEDYSHGVNQHAVR